MSFEDLMDFVVGEVSYNLGFVDIMQFDIEIDIHKF